MADPASPPDPGERALSGVSQRAPTEGNFSPGHSLARDVASVGVPALALVGGLYLVTVPGPLWIDVVLLVIAAGLLATMRVPALKRLLLAVILLEAPLQLDVYLGLDIQASADNAVSGFNLSLTTFCLLVLYTLWGAEAAATRGIGTRPATLWRRGAPTLVYFSIAAGSILIAEDRLRSAYEIVLLAQAVLIFFYVLHAVRSRRDLVFVVTFLLINLVIQGILTAVASLGAEATGPLTVTSLGDRLGGTLGHPNTLGAFLVLFLAPALAAFVALPTRSHRILAATAFGTGGIALVLSASRGAWAGAAVSLAIFLFVARRRGWLELRTILLLLACGTVVVAFSLDQILERLQDLEEGAAQARLPLMTLGGRVIGESPIFGVGLNNFAVAMHDHLTVDFTSSWISTVHNKYLLVWAETGIFGLAAFLWFLFGALRDGFRARRWTDPLLSPLGTALAAALAGSMVHMTVAIYHSRPHTHTIWLVAALLAAIGQMGSWRDEVPDQPDLRHERIGPSTRA